MRKVNRKSHNRVAKSGKVSSVNKHQMRVKDSLTPSQRISINANIDKTVKRFEKIFEEKEKGITTERDKMMVEKGFRKPPKKAKKVFKNPFNRGVELDTMNKEYSMLCEWKKTRNAFKHVCKLIRHGRVVEEAKVNYLNRTWESYPYQSARRRLVDESEILTPEEKEELHERYK